MRLFLLGLSSLLCLQSFAQLGGDANFQVLQIISPARLAALGGNSIAVKDGDLNFGIYTPSLLDSSVNKQATFGYTRLFGEANYSHVSYAQHYQDIGTFAFHFQNIGYGKFNSMDAQGNSTGSFSAGEYLFQLGYGKQLDSLFSIGANAKFVYSELAEYKATGLAMDLAGSYYNPAAEFTASVILKNIGTSLSSYTGAAQGMPFEIQAGVSKKLLKAPFRLGLTMENLQRWDLTPETGQEEEIDPLTGELIETSNSGFTENLLRHMVFNAEILLTKNFHLRFGYNYNRRRQLQYEERPGAGGICYGLGLRISKFHLSYGRETYNLAGSTNHFTVSVRFDDFVKS